MSSTSLSAATTLAATGSSSSSSGSSSPGHTSPSVSSMEEDPTLSGSEASFDQQLTNKMPVAARHADVELDAANMLSFLKHFMPAPRKGLFPPASAPAAPAPTATTAGGPFHPPTTPLTRDAACFTIGSSPSSLALALAGPTTTTPTRPKQQQQPPASLPRRPPTKAAATLFPTLSPAAYGTGAAPPPPLPAKRDQQTEPEEEEERQQQQQEEEEDDESLIIEDEEEEDEMAEQGSCFGGGGGSRYPSQRKAGFKWTAKEDARLRAGVAATGECNWETIAVEFLGGQRSAIQCSHRWQKVLRPGLVKGPWTKEEDGIILRCRAHGILEWKEIALRLPGRLGKQCRDRWLNHLDPSINKGEWTEEEDRVLAHAREQYGNAWATIAKLLPGRPENAIKNRWYSARRARERSVVAAPSGWDLRLEKHVIAEYAAAFGPDALLETFLPHVTARLRARDAGAYDAAALPEVNRQKLQRRLWAGLKREAAKYPEGSPLRHALLREKGMKVKQPLAGPTNHHTTKPAPRQPQPQALPLPLPVPPPPPSMPPSVNVAAIWGLLTAAVKEERDGAKRELYRLALEATTKGSRPALCFIEGVMGGGFAGIDLAKEADREYLLGALASAVSRGLFV